MRKALIVDDDPIIRNLVSTLLRRRGFAVAQAANGDEAIVLLRSSLDAATGTSEYDLVVLDLMMPKVSGWDVIQYIADEVPRLKSHVIVVSAFGEPAMQELQNMELGALIGKPFDAADFYAAIDSCTRPTPDDTADGGGAQALTLLCLAALLEFMHF